MNVKDKETRSAIVYGWGAVEKQAAAWDARATVREVEPRLWEARGPDGALLGYIAKEPWTHEELARRARRADRRMRVKEAAMHELSLMGFELTKVSLDLIRVGFCPPSKNFEASITGQIVMDEITGRTAPGEARRQSASLFWSVAVGDGIERLRWALKTLYRARPDKVPGRPAQGPRLPAAGGLRGAESAARRARRDVDMTACERRHWKVRDRPRWWSEKRREGRRADRRMGRATVRAAMAGADI